MIPKLRHGAFILIVFLITTNAFAFTEKRAASAGLCGQDTTPASSILASFPALIDGNKTTSTGINIGGVANDDQNIGLHLTFSSEIDKVYLYTTTPDNNFNKNNFVWDVYSSTDNTTWTLITAAASFDYNTIQQRFEISFAKTIARYFKVVNTANDAYDLYVTEIEAYGTSAKEGDINADGNVNLTDAILGLQVAA